VRFAILSDIHANLEALEAVLADARLQSCTHYVCLGDVVGYNANPSECVKIIQDLECPVVKGNHDEQASMAASTEGFNELAEEAIGWTRDHLSADDKAWLADLRLTRQVRDFTIVHATLDTPGQWGYVFNDLDAIASFTYQHTSSAFSVTPIGRLPLCATTTCAAFRLGKSFCRLAKIFHQRRQRRPAARSRLARSLLYPPHRPPGGRATPDQIRPRNGAAKIRDAACPIVWPTGSPSAVRRFQI
jgi:hypothetical protein